jgi:hypothetical protein
MSNGLEQAIDRPTMPPEIGSNTGKLQEESLRLRSPGAPTDTTSSAQTLPPADQVLALLKGTQVSTAQPRFDGAYTGSTPTDTALQPAKAEYAPAKAEYAPPQTEQLNNSIETTSPEGGFYYGRPGYGRGNLGGALAQIGLGIAAYEVNRAMYNRGGYYGGVYNGYGGCDGSGYYGGNQFGYANGWPVNQNAYYGWNTYNNCNTGLPIAGYALGSLLGGSLYGGNYNNRAYNNYNYNANVYRNYNQVNNYNHLNNHQIYNRPNYTHPNYNVNHVPHYNAPHYNAPHYNAPHYNAPHYNAPRYNAPHNYNVPHHYNVPHNVHNSYHGGGGSHGRHR